MPGIIRVNSDNHQGHSGPNLPFHLTYYNTGSSNVNADGQPVVRKGDTTLCGDIAVGASPNVFANGIPVHRGGDATSGHGGWNPTTANSGSPTIKVNG